MNVIPWLDVVEGADVVEGLHPATVDPVEGPGAAVRRDRHRGGSESYGGVGSTSSGYGGECEHPLFAMSTIATV